MIMNEIVGVEFDTEVQLKYYYVDDFKLKKNFTVVAETDKGIELGRVVTDIHPIDKKKLKVEIPHLLRVASKQDYNHYKENKKQESYALKKCKKLVKELDLDMNVIEAHYTLNKDHLMFNFYADDRIDFRDLAKELAFLYKTRIELRQIGVRDKAKKVSGIGPCGQELCCSRFLNKFDSVSISMAKNQNIALSPNKINGVCGRLLCCLNYEDSTYKACRKGMPKIGQAVETKAGAGTVKSLDVLKRTYKVELSNGNIVEEKVEDASN